MKYRLYVDEVGNLSKGEGGSGCPEKENGPKGPQRLAPSTQAAAWIVCHVTIKREIVKWKMRCFSVSFRTTIKR